MHDHYDGDSSPRYSPGEDFNPETRDMIADKISTYYKPLTFFGGFLSFMMCMALISFITQSFSDEYIESFGDLAIVGYVSSAISLLIIALILKFSLKLALTGFNMTNKVRNGEFEWLEGNVTDKHTYQSRNRHSRTLCINGINCSPLSIKDYEDARLGDSFYIIKYKKICFAMKLDSYQSY